MLKNKFYQLFKRQTTSVAFIPEIDGLRFLAIAFVVLHHIQGLYLLRAGYTAPLSGAEHWLWFLFHTDESGVLLFFAISGFILMLPFARYYLSQGQTVSLKKYYLRRVTRLEPPYLLALLGLFGLKVLLQQKNILELFPHLGASLLYLHTALYKEMSWITPITWSLEVEIQFYLFAPLLAMVFKFPKMWRRMLLAAMILAAPFLQQALGLTKFTLLGTMQYFFAGFLLVDFYVSQERINMASPLVKLLGGVLLLSLILVRPDQLSRAVLYPFLILIFYYLVLNTDFWRQIFQNKALTSIGGMCYSIYLLHFAIISFVGTKAFSFKVAAGYIPNVLVQIFIHAPVVLGISTIFYLLVEKPCMDPYWPQKLLARLSLLRQKTCSCAEKSGTISKGII